MSNQSNGTDPSFTIYIILQDIYNQNIQTNVKRLELAKSRVKSIDKNHRDQI